MDEYIIEKSCRRAKEEEIEARDTASSLDLVRRAMGPSGSSMRTARFVDRDSDGRNE